MTEQAEIIYVKLHCTGYCVSYKMYEFESIVKCGLATVVLGSTLDQELCCGRIPHLYTLNGRDILFSFR